MGLAENYLKKNVALAQSHVPDAVLAAGVFQPAGSTGAAPAGGLVGAALASAKNSKSKSGAPGFPRNTLIAVTSDRVYAFKTKSGLKWKVKEQVGSWARSDLQCSVEEKALVWSVTLNWADGASAKLESQRRGANAGNESVVRMLADPSMAHAAA